MSMPNVPEDMPNFSQCSDASLQQGVLESKSRHRALLHHPARPRLRPLQMLTVHLARNDKKGLRSLRLRLTSDLVKQALKLSFLSESSEKNSSPR